MWSHFPKMNIFHFVSIKLLHFLNFDDFPNTYVLVFQMWTQQLTNRISSFTLGVSSWALSTQNVTLQHINLLRIAESHNNNNLEMERKSMFIYCCASWFKYRTGRITLQEYQAFSVSSAFLYDLSRLKEQFQYIPVDLVTHQSRAILLQFQMIIGLVQSLPN